jgi:hypothetical protein
MNAVDTNILIYRLDHDEPIKRDKARLLLPQLLAVQQRLFCFGKWLANSSVTCESWNTTVKSLDLSSIVILALIAACSV